MTGSAPFRSCRALSFLSQSSDQFLDAQTNVTLLNNLIWGTCNTNTNVDQCTSNMGWFASELQNQCAQDLKDGNDRVVSSLTALQSYALVRTTGCLTDPTSNTYCYLDAAHNSNPADLYFYNLPLGIPLPTDGKGLSLLCSACTKSVMNTYASALQDGSQKANLGALAKTYPAAASLANTQCGTSFAAALSSSAVRRAGRVGDAGWLMAGLFVGLYSLMTFFGLS